MLINAPFLDDYSQLGPPLAIPMWKASHDPYSRITIATFKIWNRYKYKYKPCSHWCKCCRLCTMKEDPFFAAAIV